MLISSRSSPDSAPTATPFPTSPSRVRYRSFPVKLTSPETASVAEAPLTLRSTDTVYKKGANRRAGFPSTTIKQYHIMACIRRTLACDGCLYCSLSWNVSLKVPNSCCSGGWQAFLGEGQYHSSLFHKGRSNLIVASRLRLGWRKPSSSSALGVTCRHPW